MSNYWIDLIKREEELEKLRKEQERRDFEIIYQELQMREKLKALWNSQRKQGQKV
jgi:hypothetical protein